MKHLKSFNESKENFTEELKDFCENSLAYLLDDGYNVSVYKYPMKNYAIVSLGLLFENSITFDWKRFYWDDIKDSFIPFLQLLSRRYELLAYNNSSPVQFHQQVCFNTTGGFKYLSLDQVINDETGLALIEIHGINIKILDKKDI
jgi:hypothetical protein